jgi:hypothetical protein
VTINAIFHVPGASGFDFNVSFYDGGSLIGNTKASFIKKSSANASISWNPSYGNHTIIVIADPDDKINETNENNNQANKTLFVNSDLPQLQEDTVIFNYFYMLNLTNCENASSYLPQLENIFGNRLIIHKSCVYVNCSYTNPFDNLSKQVWDKIHCFSFPYTMTNGKKSISNNSIDYNRSNYTCSFPEEGKTENKTFNQWIENICYQFEVKPNVCLTCDLNHDGVIIKDYGELMAEYKCFLGISSNCRDLNGNGITFQDWSEMKHEYECFNGLA